MYCIGMDSPAALILLAYCIGQQAHCSCLCILYDHSELAPNVVVQAEVKMMQSIGNGRFA